MNSYLYRVITKIYIGGIPMEISGMELVQLVIPYGKVSTVKTVRDKATGKAAD